MGYQPCSPAVVDCLRSPRRPGQPSRDNRSMENLPVPTERELHSWDLSTTEARDLQLRLAAQINTTCAQILQNNCGRRRLV